MLPVQEEKLTVSCETSHVVQSQPQRDQISGLEVADFEITDTVRFGYRKVLIAAETWYVRRFFN